MERGLEDRRPRREVMERGHGVRKPWREEAAKRNHRDRRP